MTRLTSWRVLRDRAPFGVPTSADHLATVTASDRDEARRTAERLFPLEAVVVVHASAWPLHGETWWEDTLSITGGVTPAYFGCFTQSYTTGQLRASFPYLRYYANGTQYTTGALVWAYAPRDFTA